MTISSALLDRLSDKTLAREAGLIAGEWISRSNDDRSFPVKNPSNGNTLAMLPDMGLHETRKAINAAYKAQRYWARLTGKERAALILRWHGLIMANIDDLAIILTAEAGKPLAEAKAEIQYGAAYAEWNAEEAKRIYGDTIPGHGRDKRIWVIKQPIGVVAAITAWNFPNALTIRKAAPAFAAGCAIVFKPADETPLSAVALGILAERAGIPTGLFNVVTTTNSQEFGQEICQNPKVRKLTFTGSTEVGRSLMRQASDQIMKLSLELGGNAPFIIFDDANLEAAVEGAISAKFRNAGQTCVCANRFYVQSGIYRDFIRRFVERVAALEVGDGFESNVSIGPLISAPAVAKVRDHIDDAVSNGAKVMLGGCPHPRGGLFIEPTVLCEVTSGMKVAREETFGPLAPILRFDSTADVIEQANATEFGLAAYFFGSDLSRAWAVAEALQYGMVGINTGMISSEVAPFGGIKQSGLGREGSKYGLDDFLEIKYLCVGGISDI